MASAGVVSVIVGGVVSTTVYVCDVEVVFPAPSVAFTVKVCDPSVDVSMFAPFATEPMQVASPDPPGSSANEYEAVAAAPREKTAPSAGAANAIVGGLVSPTV